MNVFWALRHITPKWCFLVPRAFCFALLCVSPISFSRLTRARAHTIQSLRPAPSLYTKVSMNFRSAVARATIHHKANHSTIFIFVLKTMQRERTWSIHILSFPLPLPHLNHLLRFDFLVYRRVSRDNSEKCKGRRKKENFRSELF